MTLVSENVTDSHRAFTEFYHQLGQYDLFILNLHHWFKSYSHEMAMVGKMVELGQGGSTTNGSN